MLPEFLQLKLHESGHGAAQNRRSPGERQAVSGGWLHIESQFTKQTPRRAKPVDFFVYLNLYTIPQFLFRLLIPRFMPTWDKTGTDFVSFRRRLFAAGFCVSFLGLAVIKYESSSSPLHVHALFENFYRTEAIRDGKHVTTYTLCRIESRKEEVAVRLGRFLLKQEASSVQLLADRKTRQWPRLDVRP